MDPVFVVVAVQILLAVGMFVAIVASLARRGSTGATVVSKHDEVYALPLGAVPGPEGAPTRPATRDDVQAPVTVRFEPPTGVLPEQVGMLTHCKVGAPDITAAMVQLAVDGYLRLAQVPSPQPRRRGRAPRSTWLVTVLRPADARLTDFRAGLLTVLASLGRPATIVELRPVLARELPERCRSLARHPDHARWYPNLKDGRIGFGASLTTPGSRQRSALGTALRYQSAGFRHYLSIADGEQLRFEAGAGIFSRYLPWAVAYGLTEQWVAAFQAALETTDPATARVWAHDLAWYGGPGGFGDSGDGTEFGIGDGLGDLGSLDLGGLSDALSSLGEGLGDLAGDISSSGGFGGGSDGGSNSGGGDGGGGGGGD